MYVNSTIGPRGMARRPEKGIKDDPFLRAEEITRLTITRQARELLTAYVDLITEENAPRALGLIVETARSQRDLLASVALSSTHPTDSLDQYPESLGIGALTSPMADPETYGASAIEQIAETFSKAHNTPTEHKIAHLTRAYRDATSSDDEALASSIRNRLDKLLAQGNDEQVPVALSDVLSSDEDGGGGHDQDVDDTDVVR